MTEILTLTPHRSAARPDWPSRRSRCHPPHRSNAEWWADVAPVLGAIWDPRRFPTLSSPEMAHARDQDEEGERED
jgi:hypothetical protein